MACSVSESELILHEQNSGGELLISLSKSALRKSHRETVEIIPIFKTVRGSVVFEGGRKISSIPQMALVLIRELTN